MEVRYCQNGDFESIVTIDSQDQNWSIDQFKKELCRKAVICLVVEDKGMITGYILYELFQHRIQILKFGIHPEHIRKKYGTALINKLITKLKTRNLISIEVKESNLPMQLFLRKLGFLAIEVLRDYYENQEDAYIFQYTLLH